jgi:hypothetical protein
MDKATEDIKEQLGNFSDAFGPVVIHAVKVVAINEDDTAQVEWESGLVMEDVRLKSVVKDSDHFIIVPAVGSTVMIGKIEKGEEYVVLAVEAIQTVKSLTGQTRFVQDSGGFLLQKGSDDLQGLMVALLDAILVERHATNYGPTIELTPESKQRYEELKDRFKNLLKDA